MNPIPIELIVSIIKHKQRPPHVVKPLLWGSILFLLYQMTLPAHLITQEYPLHLVTRSEANQDVIFCHRLVDDWRLQLLFPGVEHYSIWLPQEKLHRGLMPVGLGLQWVDEIYLDEHESSQEILNKGLSCEAVPDVNPVCVGHEIMRQQDEGWYGPTNHCQHAIVEILTQCRTTS